MTEEEYKHIQAILALSQQENAYKIVRQYADDKTIALMAIKKDSSCYRHISDDLKQDRDFVVQAVKEHPAIFEELTEKFRDDDEITAIALSSHPRSIIYASDRLYYDKDFFLKHANFSRYLSHSEFNDLPVHLQRDRDVALEFTKERPVIIDYLSHDIIDKEIAIAAVTRYAWNIVKLPLELQHDLDVAKAAVHSLPCVFSELPNAMKSEKEIIMIAAARNGHTYFSAPIGLRRDPELALVAFKGVISDEQDRFFKKMPAYLKDNEDFLLKLANQNPSYEIKLWTLSDRLRHEIGSVDPRKYLVARDKAKTLLADLERQHGQPEEDEPEQAPKFKL